MDSQTTRVKVEFYGIPRLRAGVPEIVVSVPRVPAMLSDVIDALTSEFPDLATECFRGTSLRDGFVANLGGCRFVAEPDTQLTGSEPLLILSADAGG